MQSEKNHNKKLTLHDISKQMDERFDRVDEQFTRVDERFTRIDERFIRIDERFDLLETRIHGTELGISRIEKLHFKKLESIELPS